MVGFPGVDFLETDSLLNDDERLVRQTTREFVDREVLPIIEKHNREAIFPMHLVPQMAELGFFGANLTGYGCAGMSNVAYGQVMQELERGDSGLRSFVSVQSALVMHPIDAFGSSEQKEKWLPALRSAKAIGCFGLTEPQFGSNPAAMACYQTALEYAKTRRQFENKPIAAHQLVQDKLVWMVTEISKAQLLALHVGRLKDQDRAAPEHVSMLKMNNVWMALEAARKARDILGANGIVDDYSVMRHTNNLESVSTYEGTHDIHRLIIGERITGLSAFA